MSKFKRLKTVYYWVMRHESWEPMYYDKENDLWWAIGHVYPIADNSINEIEIGKQIKMPPNYE